MSKELQAFISRFDFNQNLINHQGVEREYFLLDENSIPTPRSSDFLNKIKDNAWTYELSACQVEHRTSPHKEILDLKNDLDIAQKQGKRIACEQGMELRAIEVADKNMPLDIYPHERYLKIVPNVSKQILSAACRVTGTHIHVGMPSIETAIEVHNTLIDCLDEFILMGDHSNGERIRLYKMMAKNHTPLKYESVDHFYEVACTQGFVDNPKDCWHLIRISYHGTVELRMFGVTENTEEIISWCEHVRSYIDTYFMTV